VIDADLFDFWELIERSRPQTVEDCIHTDGTDYHPDLVRTREYKDNLLKIYIYIYIHLFQLIIILQPGKDIKDI